MDRASERVRNVKEYVPSAHSTLMKIGREITVSGKHSLLPKIDLYVREREKSHRCEPKVKHGRQIPYHPLGPPQVKSRSSRPLATPLLWLLLDLC